MLKTNLKNSGALAFWITAALFVLGCAVDCAAQTREADSAAPEPDPGTMRMGVFKKKSATIGDFARYLSTCIGHDVLDKTGIEGCYQFDIDWRERMEEDAPGAGLAVALAGVKRLGLKLEAGKEMRKVLVVDHVNKYPTEE